MCTRAADSVFWPNITTDITRIRDECTHCHRAAKSNPMQPPCDITPPDYPFQRICADYFSFNNTEYIVIVDRYSSWPIVHRSESGADGLTKGLRETFVTFGILEEITSDGGPQFTAGKRQEFLKLWGVHHRLTSVANPHGNCRGEFAVKIVKRMLMDNTGPTGSLDVDQFQRAMLVYRNTVDSETRASTALILFGRPIRDPIPISMGRYCPHSTWKEIFAHQEKALAKRHAREHERWSEHTKLLQPLKVGGKVYIQNLVGNHPRKWERTGVVVETRQFHQYVVRIDGSGRVTLRNRQHLGSLHSSTSHQILSLRNSLPPSHIVHQQRVLTTAANLAHQPRQLCNLTQQRVLTTAVNPAYQPYQLCNLTQQRVLTTAVTPAYPPHQLCNLNQQTMKIMILLTHRLKHPPVEETDDTISVTPPNPTRPAAQKLPRAVARLLPHNIPGQPEQQPLGPRRCKQTKTNSCQ